MVSKLNNVKEDAGSVTANVKNIYAYQISIKLLVKLEWPDSGEVLVLEFS
jgi:hypothetical protein